MSTFKLKLLPLNKTLLIPLCIGALAMTLPGCGGKSDTKAAAGNTELLTRASEDTQAIYKKRCMSCHGDGLQGRIGPTTNLTQIGGRMTAEQIETQIRKGGNGMPGFQDDLKPEQINGLKDWLSGLK
jgi:cytochrome c551